MALPKSLVFRSGRSQLSSCNETDGEMIAIDSPAALPDPTYIDFIEEPWCELRIFTPGGLYR
ncbi:MAG: hypothetical protein U0175_08030 [Caldilineaceae bacterium]